MTTQASFDANFGEDVSYWMGIKTTKPVKPTQFRLAAASEGQQSKIIGSYIQASKDGINWVTLVEYDSGDQWREYATPAQGGNWTPGTYKVINVETDEEYTYFRYFNYNDRGANRLTEFQVFGEEAKINTFETFYGDIVYTGVKNVPQYDDAAIGEVIGAGASAEELVKAFDNDLSTVANLPANYDTNGIEFDGVDPIDNWMGIKTDKPIIIDTVMISVDPHWHIYRSVLQGSMDGVNWTTLYHFTDWKDYATNDEGGYWPAGETYRVIGFELDTPYQYFRYFNEEDRGGNRLAEFMVFGEEYEAPETNAPETEAPELPNTVDTYNGEIVYTGTNATSVGGSVAGEIIGGGVAADVLLPAFDGDHGTIAYLPTNPDSNGNQHDEELFEAVDYWMGIYVEEPIVPAAFRMSMGANAPGQHHKVCGSFIQASKDGINWVTLVEYYKGGDGRWRIYADPATEGGYWFATDNYKIAEVDTDEAYSYFRYFNYDDVGGNRLAEFQVFAADAAAVEGAENNAIRFNGTIVNTGVKSTSDFEEALVGEIIGAGAAADELVKAADGSLATGAYLATNTEIVDAWVGIKFPAAVTPYAFRIAMPEGVATSKIFGSYIQGSNDGVNWTTIEVFDRTQDYSTEWPAEEAYKEVYVSDDVQFTYFRYFNHNDHGSNVIGEFEVIGDMEYVEPEQLDGDINLDGSVDIADAIQLFMYSMLPEDYPIDYVGEVDFTGDGSVDIADAIQLFMYSMLPEDYPLFGE